MQVVGPIGSEDKTLAFAQQLAARVAQGARRRRRAPRAGPDGAAARRSTSIARRRSSAGLTERDVASDLLVSLASSGQVAPTYWLDKRGVQYLVSVQTPQYAIDSIDALRATPISTPDGTAADCSATSRTITRATGPANITHYNVARTFDVQANVDGTDLGSVADARATRSSPS